MLSRSGLIPRGDYAYELKFDGFRAIVGRHDGFRVLSRRKLRDPELEIVSEIEERDWVELRQVVLIHERLPGGRLIFTPHRTEAADLVERLEAAIG
jgi:hypothetical protein